MMNIDNLFRDKLNGYSEMPSDLVRSKLNRSLNRKKSSAIKVGVIIKLAAAAVITAFAAGTWLGTTISINNDQINIAQNSVNTTSVISTDTISSDVDNNLVKDNSYGISQDKTPENSRSKLGIKKAKIEVKTTKNIKKVDLTNSEHKQIKNNQQFIAQKTSPENINNKNLKIIEGIKFKELRTYPEAKHIIRKGNSLYKNDNMMLAMAETSNNSYKPSWNISGNFGTGLSESKTPESNTEGLMFSPSSGNSESNIKDTPQSESSGMQSYKGGINIEYSFAKNLSIETGLNYSEFGQNSSVTATNVYSENLANDFGGVSNRQMVNTSAGNIALKTTSLPESKRASSFYEYSAQPKLNNYNIEQSFKYLSVPIKIGYTIFNNKVKIKLKGGINSNILVDDDTSIKNNDNSYSASTEGVRPLNFSGDISVGINYPITSKININLQPSYEFYLNTINKNSTHNYKPSIISVLAGVSYKLW